MARPTFRLFRSLPRVIGVASLVAVLMACTPTRPENLPPGVPEVPDSRYEERQATGSLTGDGGILLFGGRRKSRDAQGGPSGIGVNAYLWQATLTTFADLAPLASADPFGGVVIYDWFSDPGSPNERFKIAVYILGRQLRADGIKVSVFREVRRGGGGWVSAAVSDKTGTDFENLVLTTARKLRIESASR